MATSTISSSLRRPILRAQTLQIPGTLPGSPFLGSSATASAAEISAAWAPSSLSSTLPPTLIQTRGARWVKQPRRPYMFTQIIQLSDGSTYTQRTTSPFAMYRSTKDKMNNLLWQPTNQSLQNVELDEAGRLAAFRERFGRSFDVAGKRRLTPQEQAAEEAAAAAASQQQSLPLSPEEESKVTQEQPNKTEEDKKAPTTPHDAYTMTNMLYRYAKQSGVDYAPVKRREKKSKK